MQACIFGASGGIGRALCAHLLASPGVVRLHAGSRRPAFAHDDPRVAPFSFDLESEASIAAAAEGIAADGPLDLVIVATGTLQVDGRRPERSWRDLDPAAMEAAFRVNALGPALVGKHVLPLLRRGGRPVFAALSAKVGSIADNRLGGWHGYRASKAALNQLVRNFAIELGRTNPGAIAVAIHPGTVDTPLSRPFSKSLPPGQTVSPEAAAANILRVIDGLTPADGGRLHGWDGAVIPF